MTTVSSVTSNEVSSVATPKTQQATGAGAPFESYLKGLLEPQAQGGEINEEQLFGALIQQQIQATKGDAAATQYHQLLVNERAATKRKDGGVQEERSARSALRALVGSGVLTQDEANRIHSTAFQGAQLDANKSALWDSTSGPNDPSKATATLAKAISLAQSAVDTLTEATSAPSQFLINWLYGRNDAKAPNSTDLIKDGELGIKANQPAAEPKGTKFDGADGFLWKPVSQNQGRLAVLLPAQLTGKIDHLLLRDESGKEIERGTFTSDGSGETGRTKYSFQKTGVNYSKNVTVEALLLDGSTYKWKIPDPSKRYD